MEHIHLFTEKKNADLKSETVYTCRYEYKGTECIGIFHYAEYNGVESWTQLGVHYIGEKPVITHVIDLSKLTTKEIAREVIDEILSTPTPESEDGGTYEEYEEEVNKIVSKL